MNSSHEMKSEQVRNTFRTLQFLASSKLLAVVPEEKQQEAYNKSLTDRRTTKNRKKEVDAYYGRALSSIDVASMHISDFACLLFLTIRHGDLNVEWGENIKSDKLGEGEYKHRGLFFRSFIERSCVHPH